MKSKLIKSVASLLASVALLAGATLAVLPVHAELGETWTSMHDYYTRYGICPHGIYYAARRSDIFLGDWVTPHGEIDYGNQLETLALDTALTEEQDFSIKVAITIRLDGGHAMEVIEEEAERLAGLDDFELVTINKDDIHAVTTLERAMNFPVSEKYGYRIGLTLYEESEEEAHVIYETAQTGLPGDTNGDGEIGVVDAVLLQRWLLGIGELPNWQSADLCEDGVINIYDLLKLKQMLTQI